MSVNKDLHACVNKTIETVEYSGSEVFIRFTDGTVTGLCCEREQYEDNYYISSIPAKDFSDWRLVKMGIIDQAEADRRGAMREAASREKATLDRLEQWRRLDKEFKGTPPEPPKHCICGICATHGQGACKTAAAMGWTK